MPVSPLFALVSPSTQSASLSESAQQQNPALGPLKPASMNGSGAGESADDDQAGLNFFQQLQLERDASSMANGKGVAAYLPQLNTLSNNVDGNETFSLDAMGQDILGPNEVHNQAIDIAGVQSDMAQVALIQTDALALGDTTALSVSEFQANQAAMASSPFDVTKTTLEHSKNTTDAVPQGLQHLENLRRAQPHLQAQSGLNPLTSQGFNGDERNEGTSTAFNAGALASRQAAPVLAQPEVSSVNPNQQANQLAASMANQPSKMINVDELGMQRVTDDAQLNGLDPEQMSLHEQPKTLSTLKEANATSMTQPQEPINTLEAKTSSSDTAVGALKDAGLSTTKATNLNITDTAKADAPDKAMASFNKLDVPPQHPQWNDQVAKRISIMASESVQTARIQLDPPELGSLEVKIKVQHDQVSVSFGSNNQTVRDALEGQSPRLRELLEQQGINLADVNVSEQGREQTDTQSGDGFDGEGESLDAETQEEGVTQVIESDALVDYFA